MTTPEEFQNGPVKTTPFYQAHKDLGAKFFHVGDWLRPAEYEALGWHDEHLACRATGGLFDGHSMGKVILKGPGARTLLDQLAVSRFNSLRPGRGRFTCFCKDDGGILEDLIVYCRHDEEFYLTTNTQSRQRVVALLNANASTDTIVQDVTSAIAYLALQGPKSHDVLQTMVDASLTTETLPYFGCLDTSVAGIPTLICRTGYTGERGYELNFPAEYALFMWWRILEIGRAYGIVPCGTRALQTLRLEKTYLMYGQDISERTTPLEAGLMWLVDFRKPSFAGREALLRISKTEPRRRLTPIRSITGNGFASGSSLTLDGRVVGSVTSADFGPSVRSYIGLAYLDGDIPLGAEVRVDGDGDLRAVVSGGPFVDPAGERVRS